MKTVILCGGMGTRVLPISKTIPKEMLPIGDQLLLHKNIISYYNSGIKDFIIVNTSAKKIIEDSLELDLSLEKYNCIQINELNSMLIDCNIVFTRQKISGTGGALLSCEKRIEEEYFNVIFGDMLIDVDNSSNLSKMLELHQGDKSVIATKKFHSSYREKYGETIVEEGIVKHTTKINRELDSEILMSVGCFILHRSIFKKIKQACINYDYNNPHEISLMTGINLLCNEQVILNYEAEKGFIDFGNIEERKQFNKSFSL